MNDKKNKRIFSFLISMQFLIHVAMANTKELSEGLVALKVKLIELNFKLSSLQAKLTALHVVLNRHEEEVDYNFLLEKAFELNDSKNLTVESLVALGFNLTPEDVIKFLNFLGSEINKMEQIDIQCRDILSRLPAADGRRKDFSQKAELIKTDVGRVKLLTQLEAQIKHLQKGITHGESRLALGEKNTAIVDNLDVYRKELIETQALIKKLNKLGAWLITSKSKVQLIEQLSKYFDDKKNEAQADFDKYSKAATSMDIKLMQSQIIRLQKTKKLKEFIIAAVKQLNKSNE